MCEAPLTNIDVYEFGALKTKLFSYSAWDVPRKGDLLFNANGYLGSPHLKVRRVQFFYNLPNSVDLYVVAD